MTLFPALSMKLIELARRTPRREMFFVKSGFMDAESEGGYIFWRLDFWNAWYRKVLKADDAWYRLMDKWQDDPEIDVRLWLFLQRVYERRGRNDALQAIDSARLAIRPKRTPATTA